jgi:GT2 family glycosyltransferase
VASGAWPEPPARAARGPLVSLLLPNRNNEPVLDLFLERLAVNTTYPGFEVVAVDDGSTDDSVAVLERWRRSGRIRDLTVITKPHSGIVDTLNVALAHATGEIAVRLDGDATLETPGWLERMLELHAADERVGVVTGKVVLEDGRLQSLGVDVVGPEGVHDRGCPVAEPVGRRTLDTRVLRPPEAEVPEAARPAEVDSAMGCCQSFSVELAREIGGWDPAWSPVWYEDFDFALGARRLGRKVFCLPDIRIVHRISLRNPRSGGRGEALLVRLRRGAGRHLPARLRAAAARATRVGDLSPERVALLRRHHEHWRRKWGWDPLNPDLEQLRARWGSTEVCWAQDPAMRRAGEEILERVRR